MSLVAATRRHWRSPGQAGSNSRKRVLALLASRQTAGRCCHCGTGLSAMATSVRCGLAIGFHTRLSGCEREARRVIRRLHYASLQCVLQTSTDLAVLWRFRSMKHVQCTYIHVNGSPPARLCLESVSPPPIPPPSTSLWGARREPPGGISSLSGFRLHLIDRRQALERCPGRRNGLAADRHKTRQGRGHEEPGR